MTHPSGYRPDEVAGQRTVHMHCIWHAPAQLSALPRLSPEKLPLFETVGFWTRMLRATIQREMLIPHTLLLMTQDVDLEDVVRSRIRGLRVAEGGPSTTSLVTAT